MSNNILTMSEIVQTLGNNIRLLRKECGWTQEMLAEKINISVPYMTQIELGRRNASLEIIESIADTLNVPYSRLFLKKNGENIDKKYIEMFSSKEFHVFITEAIIEFIEKNK